MLECLLCVSLVCRLFCSLKTVIYSQYLTFICLGKIFTLKLNQLIKSFKDTLTKDYEKQLKAKDEEIAILKANGVVPPKGTPSGAKTITEAQFNAMDTRDHAAFFASGGTISG